VLASDGLDAVSDGKIVFTGAAADSAQSCVAALLNAVNAVDHPKQDNTTVIVYRYGAQAIHRTKQDDDDVDFEKTLQPGR
jgi:serine/threonine protein phosphatase PrpC